MKSSIYLSLICAIFIVKSVPAYAIQVPACQRQAARTVARQFREYFQPTDGRERRIIELVECQDLVSRGGKPYNKCEVSASNGKGAGDVTFEVILSGDCRMSYAAYITGME